VQVVPHGGVAEIGGNAIEVSSGKTRLLLDFGVPFGRYGRSFSNFLKPRKVNGISDWLLADVAPDLPGLYRSDLRKQSGMREEPRAFDGVLLSHPHMDHIGLVPLLRDDIQIASSRVAYGVAQAVEETGGSFDQTDFVRYREQFRFRKSTKKGEEDKLVRIRYSDDGDRGEEPPRRPWSTRDSVSFDGITAHFLPVDHSIHGARGILLEGDVQLAYSGDLRMHGRNKQWTERWVERCAGVDTLLVEGTNVANHGKNKAGGILEDFHKHGEKTEAEVEEFIAEGLQGETGYVFVAYPQRDLDRLETFRNVARRTGRRLCLTPKQAHLLDVLQGTAREGGESPLPSTTDADLRIYVPRKQWGLVEREDLLRDHPDLAAGDYQAWERPYLNHPNRVLRRDIAADPGSYLVFADIWSLTELHEFQPDGGVYVYSKTEPFSEEMEMDVDRMLRWLARWDLRLLGAHVSGHARLHELVWMADQMGAKRVIPIHTEGTEAFAKALGKRAIVPTLGQAM
jgi:ribonuclease J